MSLRAWRWYPRHIAGQIAIVVITSIGLALTLLIVVVIMTRPEADLQNSSRTVDALLSVARLLDATADPNSRSNILEASTAAFPELQIKIISAQDTLYKNDRNDRFVQFLRQVLGPRFDISGVFADTADARKVVVDIVSQNGLALRATLPAFVPPAPPLTPIVTGTLVFVVASVFLLLLWATKALTAPLSQFANAAEQFGRNFEQQTLTEQGPEEIRKASRAFNKMGERIKRLVDDRTNMLAAISHDLRTPITRMRLRAEFVEDKTVRGDMIRDLEDLNEMVQSALAFIRDSRVENAATRVDLPCLLQTICEQFAEMGQDVSYHGAQQMVVMARPDALQRAVTNLVENALKFGTKATIELQDLPDGNLAIDILDEGPGLADADPKELIRPFVRGDNARTQNQQSGFGLGLTIANSIIEAHGGKLTFRNRQPRGLSVRLTLSRDCWPVSHESTGDA
jgi:signal transduction histidine kinase